eukprot:227108-Rhodomonas_salina.2
MERERGLEWFGAPQIASLSHHLWWYCSRGDAHVTCMVSAAASDSRDSVGVYMAPISVAALEGISALAMQYPALTSNVEQPVLPTSALLSAYAIGLCAHYAMRRTGGADGASYALVNTMYGTDIAQPAERARCRLALMSANARAQRCPVPGTAVPYCTLWLWPVGTEAQYGACPKGYCATGTGSTLKNQLLFTTRRGMASSLYLPTHAMFGTYSVTRHLPLHFLAGGSLGTFALMQSPGVTPASFGCIREM